MAIYPTVSLLSILKILELEFMIGTMVGLEVMTSVFSVVVIVVSEITVDFMHMHGEQFVHQIYYVYDE